MTGLGGSGSGLGAEGAIGLGPEGASGFGAPLQAVVQRPVASIQAAVKRKRRMRPSDV